MKLVKDAVEESMIDLIGAQVVLYGSYYDDAIKFYEYEWLKYKQEFNEDLNGYIINEFESRDYINSYGYIYNDRNQFFGAREADYYSNRAEFVDRHYRNKYGRLPFTMQSYIGVNKMWASRNLEMLELPQISFLI